MVDDATAHGTPRARSSSSNRNAPGLSGNTTPWLPGEPGARAIAHQLKAPYGPPSSWLSRSRDSCAPRPTTCRKSGSESTSRSSSRRGQPGLHDDPLGVEQQAIHVEDRRREHGRHEARFAHRPPAASFQVARRRARRDNNWRAGRSARSPASVEGDRDRVIGSCLHTNALDTGRVGAFLQPPDQSCRDAALALHRMHRQQRQMGGALAVVHDSKAATPPVR
jgi:hypothetical protein